MHFFGGDDWQKVWNPKMRDMLVDTQDNSTSKDKNGSWAPRHSITGSGGGRLTVTCLSLLTLEVYYRYLPTFRDGTTRRHAGTSTRSPARLTHPLSRFAHFAGFAQCGKLHEADKDGEPRSSGKLRERANWGN